MGLFVLQIYQRVIVLTDAVFHNNIASIETKLHLATQFPKQLWYGERDTEGITKHENPNATMFETIPCSQDPSGTDQRSITISAAKERNRPYDIEIGGSAENPNMRQPYPTQGTTEKFRILTPYLGSVATGK
jgi:hypothetical protein